MGKKGSHGLTLLEIMIVVAMLSMLAAMSVLGLDGTSRRALGSDVLAQLVADHLRQARSEALNQSVPTALVFPSNNGLVPHSQACYYASGEAKARIGRVVKFSGDMPNSCIFVGVSSSGSATAVRPPSSAKLGDFKASGWLNSKDYQFIFLPSGALVTNDLPLVDGKYVLVVAAGVRYATGSVSRPSVPVIPPPTYFAVSEAMDPYTITVTQEGEVDVVPGLPGGGGSSSGAQGWMTEPAQPPLPPARASTVPIVVGMQVLPEVDPSLLPPGVDAVVRDKEYLSLRVRATDAAGGGPLFCEMQALDDSNTNVDGFAAVGPLRMEWNAAAAEWTSEWSWTPPPRYAPGSKFTIRCKVTTPEGLFGELPLTAVPRIEKTSGGKFLISGNGSAITINDDGTNERKTESTSTYFGSPTPRFSKDGQFMVFDTTTYYDAGGLKIVGQDGTLEYSVAFPPMRDAHWDITHDGGVIIKSKGDINGVRLPGLDMVRLDTGLVTSVRNVMDAGSEVGNLRCSPTGTHLAYVAADDKLRVQTLNQTTGELGYPPVLEATVPYGSGYGSGSSGSSSLMGIASLDFSPDGSSLAYFLPATGQIKVVSLATSATTTIPTSLVDPYTYSENVAWSPDGGRIALLKITEVEIFPVGGGPTKSFALSGGSFTSISWRQQ